MAEVLIEPSKQYAGFGTLQDRSAADLVLGGRGSLIVFPLHFDQPAADRIARVALQPLPRHRQYVLAAGVASRGQCLSERTGSPV